MIFSGSKSKKMSVASDLLEKSGGSSRSDLSERAVIMETEFPDRDQNSTLMGAGPQMQARVTNADADRDGQSSLFSQIYAQNHLAVAALVSGGVLLIATVVLYSAYRRKKRLHQNYEEFPEDHITKSNGAKPVDPAVYNYVCPQRSIDFVVPAIPTTCAALQASVETASVSTASSPEGSGSLWSKLSLLEGGPTLLGGLNPELYKAAPEEPPEEVNFPDGHRGRLWFGVDYDPAAERLLVRLVKAKNLPSRVYGAINCCDPFVRIHLIPDERRFLQSKLKRKNCNPVFEETFVFQVPGRTAEERTLQFTVYDNDRGKHHNVIGSVLFPLRDILKSSEGSVVLWRDLEKDGQIQVPHNMGEMMVSLCYNQSLERLIVTVCEARGLKLPEGFKSIDSYVKLTLMKDHKAVKTKKTMTVKNSTDPKYNESFHFRMSQNAVNSSSIIVQVTQVAGKEKDKSLGRVILGSYMFSRGKGLEHWDEAMSAGHKQIRYWHKLT